MRKLASCLLVPIACLVVPTLAAAQEVQWRHDYNAARKEAEAKGLPLVIDFGTENCFYCRKLDENTFRDATVSRVMNEQFVPLKIDANREPTLTQMLSIQSYPTIVMAAPDGKIIGTMVGYKEAPEFHENLQRVLALVVSPAWMVRDCQEAEKAAEKGDFPQAIGLLKAVLEDGKGRPVQAKADKLFKEVEGRAAARLTAARRLSEKGQAAEATDALAALVRDFAGTQTARAASDQLSALSRNTDVRTQQRARRARELLAQAVEDRKQQQFLSCLDRCELLIANYGDLAEATQAVQMAADIKDNPEWLQAVCQSLDDRLSGLYLSQAETWVRRNQPQQAVLCLEKVLQRFPGSRQAEGAQ